MQKEAAERQVGAVPPSASGALVRVLVLIPGASRGGGIISEVYSPGLPFQSRGGSPGCEAGASSVGYRGHHPVSCQRHVEAAPLLLPSHLRGQRG